MNIRVAVIIVTYNGSRWIGACLESLRREREHQVIIVDNASHDDTVQIVERECPQALVIRSAQNLGFGRANNLGITRALEMGAEYVFLLNQDTTVQEGAIAHLVGCMDRHPDFGVLSTLLLSYDGQGLPTLLFQYMEQGGQFMLDLLAQKTSDVYSATFVPATAVLVRRAALQQVGGFDPLFFLYGEDVDLCRRMREAGWRLGVVPRAVVRHVSVASSPHRGIRWHCNWEHTRLLLRLKESKRPVPVQLARVLASWVMLAVRSSQKSLGRAYAFCKCITQFGRIERQRGSAPSNRIAVQEVVGK